MRFLYHVLQVDHSSKEFGSDHGVEVVHDVNEEESAKDRHRQVMHRLPNDLEVFKLAEHLNNSKVSQLENCIDPREVSPVCRAIQERIIKVKRQPEPHLETNLENEDLALSPHLRGAQTHKVSDQVCQVDDR